MRYFLLFVCYTLSLCGCNTARSLPPRDQIHYLNNLQNEAEFHLLAGRPLSEKYGNVEAIKLVYVLKTQTLYFVNGSKYAFHNDFCQKYLHSYSDIDWFNKIEYGSSPLRQFVLANVNHYTASDTYTLEFFADDEVPNNLLLELYYKVSSNVYFGKEMKVLANSDRMLERQKNMGDLLPWLNIDQIYAQQSYQALYTAGTFGYWRKVPVTELKKQHFTRHDIIFTNGLPNDFPLVAGILTTCFQTPLCHINILSANRKTPNAAFKTAWDNPYYASLQDSLVYYRVTADSIVLRKATLAEATNFWKKQPKKRPQILATDRKTLQLLSFDKIRYHQTHLVGGKAANFAELHRIKLPNKTQLPLPEGGFAIPLAFYFQHIQRHHLQFLVDSLSNSEVVNQQPDKARKWLRALRDSIKNKPVSPQLLNAIERRIAPHAQQGYPRFRFRSSTNAEDIPEFNGAGLYSSKTGVYGDSKQSIEKAIQQVWASLWSERAFWERDYWQIDQKSVGMGILAHRAFGTEAANGVAITKNLYRQGYPAFTINTQVGETSVVLPSDTIQCEQTTVTQDRYITNKETISIDYIAYSSLNKQQPILSKPEMEQLCNYLETIKAYYYSNTNYRFRYDNYYDFGLDIEFKLDSTSRKVYIKQTRLYPH
ncbi:MAG: hypothetical protein JNM36_11750 [Chitinophagales bacterium]|nr:hypothetical protein [Chitinophagales bacterium]